MVPAVISTDSSSSVGSLLDWIIGTLVPFLGGVLIDVFYKVSVAASQQSGLAGGLLGRIPANIPFGDKAIALPANTTFTMPNFAMLTPSEPPPLAFLVPARRRSTRGINQWFSSSSMVRTFLSAFRPISSIGQTLHQGIYPGEHPHRMPANSVGKSREAAPGRTYLSPRAQ